MRFMLVCALVGVLGGAASAQKIGVMDLHRAVNETSQGKQARGRLKGALDDRQKQLEAKTKELSAQSADLEKQRSNLKADAYQKSKQELERRARALDDDWKKLHDDTAQLEPEVIREILKDARKLIDQVAQRDGYALILEKTESSVLYAGKGLEITDEVIKGMGSSR